MGKLTQKEDCDEGFGLFLCLQDIGDLVFHVCQYGILLGQTEAGIYMECWNMVSYLFPLKWIHIIKHHMGNPMLKSSVKN